MVSDKNASNIENAEKKLEEYREEIKELLSHNPPAFYRIADKAREAAVLEGWLGGVKMAIHLQKTE